MPPSDPAACATGPPGPAGSPAVLGAPDEAAFRAVLVTRGRRTNSEHAVPLRAVSRSGKLYFSRHLPDGDWYLNAAANPDVAVIRGEQSARGTARIVSDEGLLRTISELKYPGQERARERRVAIEVSLDEGRGGGGGGPAATV